MIPVFEKQLACHGSVCCFSLLVVLLPLRVCGSIRAIEGAFFDGMCRKMSLACGPCLGGRPYAGLSFVLHLSVRSALGANGIAALGKSSAGVDYQCGLFLE